MRPVICLDPGHPSEVGKGAAGRRITEIDAAWAVALRVRALLERTGVTVVLTKRRPEEFVTNRARAEVANRAGAALFIRLHCDSEGGSGFAIYVPERTGRSGQTVGPSAQVLRASLAAGRILHAAMHAALAGVLPDRGLHPDTDTRVGAGQGALTGSIFSHVPVVLVEMAVLTNRRDDALMASTAGQERMAAAITRGALAAVRAVAAE
jgi:N-acetylmuramoyl-L-alanine amidase